VPECEPEVEAVACWSERGCDDEMQAECPHAIDPEEQCPLGCMFAKCERPTHEPARDMMLILDPFVDRRAAAKEICTTCTFFLTNGPRIE